MAMNSGVECVPVAMVFEGEVMVYQFLNAYRSFWILCPVKLYRTRTGHFCLHCPFCAGLAEETERLAGQFFKLGTARAYHFHFETIHVDNASKSRYNRRQKKEEQHTHTQTTQSQYTTRKCLVPNPFAALPTTEFDLMLSRI